MWVAPDPLVSTELRFRRRAADHRSAAADQEPVPAQHVSPSAWATNAYWRKSVIASAATSANLGWCRLRLAQHRRRSDIRRTQESSFVSLACSSSAGSSHRLGDVVE